MNEHHPVQASAQNAVGRFLFDHAVVLLALLVAATTLSLFLYLNALQDQLVAALAEQGTRQQSETLEELRGLYTSDVVEKVRGHGVSVTHDYQGKDNTIPLPATLTIELGRRIGERGSGMNVRLYSEYPFPWRKDGGPRDAFERDALAALGRDPTHAFSRVEEYQGQSVIRYAVADRMRAACVACHNSHPASPKTDWKEGDVRGVLEVTRPISAFAAAARSGQRQAFGLMTAVAIVGLAGIALVFGKQRLNARKLGEEIEERKRAEAELMASAARLSAMDEASPLGTFVTDAQGRCVHVNPRYQKIAGYSAEAMRGALWSACIHPEDRDRVLADWQAFLPQHDHTFNVECRLLRGDGSITWASCKVAAMSGGQRHLGYVGTLEDISERKKVERMKNEFVSTVSHELRTPLTSIMGSLGLLAGGVSGEITGQAKTLVDIARKNGERLVRLINDILDIEKIESGSMHFNLQPLELQHLVEQAVAANHAYAEQLGVFFTVAAPMPGVQARVDADALMQVMTNLMSNAAKFSPAGAAVELRLARHGAMIRLSVTDHGPGIPDAFRAKIFGKFSQADASDSRQKGGTGLGLAISKAIVEKMGGSIGFVTREGEGTTFHVDLPEWIEPVPSPAGADSAALHRPRVLVCEDDRDVAALLCMMLDQAGYDTVPAYDAASARRLLAEGTFAAVTLDIHLPDIDGRAFLRELRDNPTTRDQFVVVVSGSQPPASPQDDESYGLGVADWLAKPIDRDRLVDAIRRGTRSATDGKRRVLHVEDDADVRQVVATLCGEFAEFEGAASFREAVQLLSTRRYDLVILDLELPDRWGWDLLSLIDQQTPRPPVLVFSGSELSSAESGRVAAALVKSHVSNPELQAAILALTGAAQ